jgi:hypothetical protein
MFYSELKNLEGMDADWEEPTESEKKGTFNYELYTTKKTTTTTQKPDSQSTESVIDPQEQESTENISNLESSQVPNLGALPASINYVTSGNFFDSHESIFILFYFILVQGRLLA